MEIMASAAATANNQKELRLYAPNEQQTANSTNSSLTDTGARSPFQREVREWQRIDPDTGALLTGRLEADRWINGPLSKYGKISDSQNISQPNGTQQTQRKQLEVLQTCTASGGAMQVIRSQKVQTTSSRWSTSSASASASPLLLSANTSPITTTTTQQQSKRNNSNKQNNSFKQKTLNNNKNNNNNTATNKISSLNSNKTSTSSPTPHSTTLLSNGFNHTIHQQQLHHHHLQQQQQQPKLQHLFDQLDQQYPHSLANGLTSKRNNRNWPDLTENISTLDICDNDHDTEHDHDNDYIVEQSSDEDKDHDDDSLADDNEHHQHHHHYLLNKHNNSKNSEFSKRQSFTLFENASNNDHASNHDHDSHSHHHHPSHQDKSNNNLSRDSSSGSCSNNQLFLLDTAPSLKLSNLMKSSSSLSNSSNNSTTASQSTAKTMTTTTTATTKPATSLNTHKNMATNKISLHAIVSNNNNNSTLATTTTSSSTPSPTFTTTRPSWQQPSLFRQNSNNNNNNSHSSQQHLMKSRVGDTLNNNNNSNCCSSSNLSSSGDESRSYATTGQRQREIETDLRHHRQQSPNDQQQIHFKQNDRLTPTHLPHTYHRVDLESFRHYHNNDNNNIHNNDVDDDGLRLSSRHLRRQQIPSESSASSLQRSISTDDLSTEWDIQGGDTEEPAEWRRVSKLRRSFQSSTKNQQSYNSPVPTRKPLDLPTNSVSVSRIRAELENGRRLNTVMRNNHVDLAALSSILNGSGASDKETKSPLSSKRSSFLTAESLKEIRGKLKKLSDESLYKEDFVLSQEKKDKVNDLEHLVNDHIKVKRNSNKSPERYRITNQTEEVNKSNSLESRLKYRDTNSTDWHLRRKSYGFEKMSPPEKAMLRMDASTDSGLGRSGELQNWSPTSEAGAAPAPNRTVVHLGEGSKVSPAPIVQRRYRPQKSYEESENSHEEDTGIAKRHSIAVDESQYVRDNSRQTTQIHLNGFYEPANYSKFVQTSESTTTNDRGQQKRVEFSKTEVHFATESGRVNIVETDSKPPPTNNFRRRRSRSTSAGPLQSLVKSASTVTSTTTTTSSIPSGVAMPITLFGDDSSKKKTLASTTVAYRAPLVGSPEPKDLGINVTVTIPKHHESSFAYAESSRSSYASTSGVDTTDCDTDEMTSLRGILKNKPAKPKPYVLGENIEKPDDLWGVQLKPVGQPLKTERVFKSESPPLISALSQKSVAERIQELGSSHSSNFSTKINVSVGNSLNANNTNPWEDTGLITTTSPKRNSNVQDMLMHDLKEHQKILDEGLKSTTLIIKTMRSANEFDEAMRRLSIASIEEEMVVKPTTMLRSNSNQESTYSSDIEDVQGVYKSTSFSSTSSWSSTVASSRKYSEDSRKTSTDSGASFPRKDSTPRLSFLGNEKIPVSQQLQRLRLIYDAATVSQEEDSADEEVKSYFNNHLVDSDSGGGTQDSSSYEDDPVLDYTNSWSRLKARKTIWKIEADIGGKMGEGSLKRTLDKTELPKSNVMSIKLHSPQAGNEMQPALKVVPPIAKPRTVTKVQETQMPKIHTTTTVKQASSTYQTSLPTKDSLKIIKEARGARQLRDHELSYFGVPASTSEDEKPKSKYTTNSSYRNSPKRSLTLRRLSEESTHSQESTHKQREQWLLDNDKPDLLKHHHPIEVKPAERLSLKKKAQLDEEAEHLYENIASEITPVFKVKAGSPQEQYDRKMDLQRDAMILSEMNQNADQTLRELSDEAAVKDRRRRSLQRRNSKPLETIDEKSITERINDTCIAVKISRSTYSSEAKKTSRHSTPSPTGLKTNTRERTSSQSSVECCPRARSRSLSSEKEFDNSKSKTARTMQVYKHKTPKPTQSRSSSLDSQRSAYSQYSSGEEQQHQPLRSMGSLRRDDRSRTKTKRITSSSTIKTRDNKPREEKPRSHQHHSHPGDSKRLSSTTHSSTHRERVECKHDNAVGSSTSQHPQHRHHSSSSSGLQRSTVTSSSGRRQRDDLRDSQRIKRSSATTASGRSTSERHHDRLEQPSSDKHSTTRSSRDDERNSSQRSSSHRLERGSGGGDKEKEKTSSSRSSKGHSSRLTTSHHHPDSRSSTNPDKHSSSKDFKTKSSHSENTTSSKNAQHQHHRPSHHKSRERKHKSRERNSERTQHRQEHKSKREEDQNQQHVHGLKSAIIKTTAKLRDRSRSKKDQK